MSKVTFKLVKKTDNKFLEDWEDLWNNTEGAHFYNSPYWFDITSSTPSENSFVFTAWKNGKLVAVLPLVKTRKFLINVLTGPGREYLDKSALLVKEREEIVLEKLLEYASKHGSIQLRFLEESLANSFSEPGKELVKRFVCSNPYILIKDDPLRFLVSGQKNKIKNRIEKYKDNLDWESHKGDFEGVFDKVLEIEKKSHKIQIGIDTFSDPCALALFEKTIQNYPDNLSINILYFDGKPICYEIGFLYKKTFLGVQTAFDKNYSKVIPGKVLLWKLLKKLKREEYEVFDFSKGDSVFKSEFTKLKRKQFHIFYSKHGFIRAWWRFCFGVTQALKKNKTSYGLILKFKKILPSFSF